MSVAPSQSEEGDTDEPTARVVGTVASHLEDRIGRSERALRDKINDLDRRLEQRFDLTDRLTSQMISTVTDMHRATVVWQEKATELQEAVATHWREQANEWRKAMTDRERNFLSRDTAEQMISGVTDKIAAVASTVDGLDKRLDQWHGEQVGGVKHRDRTTVVLGALLAAATVLVGVLTVVLNLRGGG